MLDLDIGMNEWLCRPFAWDDSRKLDHGKVMTYEELEAGKDFGRYLDVDGDGIPYRTLPGVHPDRGAYFTRGTSRDPYARYSEEGPVYVANMERLLKKFETAKSLIPKPVARLAKRRTPHGVIYYGSTTPAMHESLELLEGGRLSTWTPCACAASPSATRSTTSSPGTSRCSWSSRTATASFAP